MIVTVATILALAAITVAFWKPVLGWVILSLPLAWFIITLYSVRPGEKMESANLSPKANELLSKFGHYYQRPFAGSDYSSAASGVGLASLVVAAIGAYKGFWWGIAVGVVFYMTGSHLARQFNPSNFLVDEEEERAHEEILLYMDNKKDKYEEYEDI